jgi:hypothetical protein
VSLRQWSRRRQVSRTPRGVRRQPVVRALAAAVSIGASAAALASGPPRLFRSSSLSGRVPKRASSSAASLTVRSAPGCPAVSHAMEDLLNTINSFTKDDSKWCSDWDRVCDLRCVSCRECIPPRRAAGAPPLQIQGLNIRPSTRSAPLAKKHASDEFISLCAKYIPGRKRRLISLADYEFAAILVESGALCIFTSDCVRVFLFWGLRGGWRRFPCCSNEFHELCHPNWRVYFGRRIHSSSTAIGGVGIFYQCISRCCGRETPLGHFSALRSHHSQGHRARKYQPAFFVAPV